MVPVIDTPRLRLRGHAPADLAARTAIFSDPAVHAHAGGVAQDRAESWSRILRYAGHWALLGWGLFAVEDRADGRFVGEVGLARFERGFGPEFDAAPEAAWVFASDVHGRGYAREAAAAALAWHERAIGAERFVCAIAAANAPSLRLAARLGFRPFGQTEFRGGPTILHERLPKGGEAR